MGPVQTGQEAFFVGTSEVLHLMYHFSYIYTFNT